MIGLLKLTTFWYISMDVKLTSACHHCRRKQDYYTDTSPISLLPVRARLTVKVATLVLKIRDKLSSLTELIEHYGRSLR